MFLEHGKEHDTFMMPWGTKSAFRAIGASCDRKFRAGLPWREHAGCRHGSCGWRGPVAERDDGGRAADILDASRSRIYAMARDGIFKVRKADSVLMISTGSVKDRFNVPRKAGRPGKGVIET